MYYIGIDLGGTNIAAGLVTEDGVITKKVSTPTLLERGPEPIIKDMGNLCLRLIQEAGVALSDVRSVGIGVPGLANNDTGDVIFCTNLKWHNVPLGKLMRQIIDKPIHMENDATVAGFAEYAAGVCKGARNSLFLTLGTGVGGGIVIDGKIYSGTHHAGSELGHMIVEMNGRLCTCGGRGCWERYASATALIADGAEAMKGHPESDVYKAAGGDADKVTAKIVIDAAKAGDPVGRQVFERYVEALAIGIIGLINLFDPEVIALGGGVSAAGEFLRAPVEKYVREHRYCGDVEQPKILLSSMGNDAGIIGAAMMGRG